MTNSHDNNGSTVILEGLRQDFPGESHYLGQVFADTTASYKLFWFLALLETIQRADTVPIGDVFQEMTVAAWHPVCYFRLSLGYADKLQDAVRSIQDASHLDPNADLADIRDYLKSSANAADRLMAFARYVPTRFLTPWFRDRLRSIPADHIRTTATERFAAESQSSPSACPYWIERRSNDILLRFNPRWRAFLISNARVVQDFARYSLAAYLQSRNPNVPGIINKLAAPSQRNLTAARRFWRNVQQQLASGPEQERFRDLYTGQLLPSQFSIDHFLPWSFVAHDQLWNLAPVEPTTNSAKRDSLPDLDIYLPRLADLHWHSLRIMRRQPRILEDYAICFKTDIEHLVDETTESLERRYREVVSPQVQLAINQGFPANWRVAV